MTVIKNLPQLQKLDNVMVQPDEVGEAMRRGVELVHPHDRPIPGQVANENIPYNYGPQSYQVRHLKHFVQLLVPIRINVILGRRFYRIHVKFRTHNYKPF